MNEHLYTCQRIWSGYKTYANGASVIRKGFELVGAADITDDTLNLKSTFMRRSESILEHQAKTAWLASVFMSNFPDFFGKTFVVNYPLDVWKYITTELHHDIGESEIGDIPDDGNPMHDTKDETELAVFKEFVQAYSFVDRKELIETFQSFQKKDSRPAQALFALDKTDAVLTQLVLERCGINGDITAKANPTEQDLCYAKITGSTLAADVWGMQLLSRLYYFPTSITQPVFTLLNVAARDVRGKNFSWLEEEP